MESLHNFARHASCNWISALVVEKFRRKYGNFVSNDMAATIRIGEWVWFTKPKTFGLTGPLP